MSDKELLELAAKAADIKPFSYIHDQFWIQEYGFWNPLRSDGDALRLAVKLDIVIWECSQYNCALTEIRYGKNQGEVTEPIQDEDRYAATRRAIVRAAAEIGKTL